MCSGYNNITIEPIKSGPNKGKLPRVNVKLLPPHLKADEVAEEQTII